MAAFKQQFALPGEHDSAVLRLLDHLPVAPTKATRTDVSAFAAAIVQDLAGHDLPRALSRLKNCLRFHDIPQIWAMAAKLYLMHNYRQTAFAYIVKLLQDELSPYRDEGFACLAEYYRKANAPDKAQRILAELKHNSV